MRMFKNEGLLGLTPSFIQVFVLVILKSYCILYMRFCFQIVYLRIGRLADLSATYNQFVGEISVSP